MTTWLHEEDGIINPDTLLHRIVYKAIPDSIETLSNHQKTSLEGDPDSTNVTKLSPSTPRSSMTDNNLKFVIGRLVGHKLTPRETLLAVRYYGYNPTDDTFKLQDTIQSYFKTT